MTVDPQTLPAGRELDRLVAEALDWWDLRDAGGYLVGWPPPHRGDGTLEYERVPDFSTTDAALSALEQWQKRVGGEVEIVVQEADGEHKWAAAQAHTEWFHAPTIYLAICRLIVASEKGSNDG